MKYIKYLPSVDDISEIEYFIKGLSPDDLILIGEYGQLNPFSIYYEIKSCFNGEIFIEINARDKNKDLIVSYICTAFSLGFKGLVISSGKFEKKEGMAKPVYDLDPSQILMVAVSLKEKKFGDDFIIGIRSASGTGAVYERAKFFIENGADFLVFDNNNVIEDFKNRTVIIQEISKYNETIIAK